jgi:bifunctional ADP-heptose synthase (sugar kinase/adenylyltransferase)
VELNRLDTKNWTPTPAPIQHQLAQAVMALRDEADAFVVLDQVDVAETGVVTAQILSALDQLQREGQPRWIVADSRRGLQGFPPVCFKMNRAELTKLTGKAADLPLDGVKETAADLAIGNRAHVFVTLAEHGMVGATPDGEVHHLPALPVEEPIDIVGAGDAVTANLTAALAAGGTLVEALALASAGASQVIHQVGTTGAASVLDLKKRLKLEDA